MRLEFTDSLAQGLVCLVGVPGLTGAHALEDRVNLFAAERDDGVLGGQEYPPAVPVAAGMRIGHGDGRRVTAELALALHADQNFCVPVSRQNVLQRPDEGTYCPVRKYLQLRGRVTGLRCPEEAADAIGPLLQEA